MTTTRPELTPAEADLLGAVGAWSAMYLNLTDSHTALAESLEAKGYVKIDRVQAFPLLTVELVHPVTPVPMPGLTVLPKIDHAEGMRDYYFGPRNANPPRPTECEYCSAPTNMPHLKDCPDYDARDTELDELRQTLAEITEAWQAVETLSPGKGKAEAYRRFGAVMRRVTQE